MKTTTAVLGAALIAGGLLGGALLQRTPAAADAAGAGEIATRVSALERQLALLAQERDGARADAATARREAAEALEVAHDLELRLARVNGNYEELLGFLTGTAPSQAATRIEAPNGESPFGTAAGADQTPFADPTGEATLAALGTPQTDGSVAPSPEATAVVRAALDQIREQEDAERRTRREERMQRRVQERLDQLTERLNLAPQQREQIETIWATTREQRTTLFEAVRAGDMARDEVRAEMQTLRETETAQVNQLLDPVQQEEYAKYQEETQDDRRRGGFGR
jgi:outer membrane murein-binding lipoprotein Lpp